MPSRAQPCFSSAASPVHLLPTSPQGLSLGFSMDSAGQLDSVPNQAGVGGGSCSDSTALAGGAASLALGGPWPGLCVTTWSARWLFSCSSAGGGAGERAGEKMSDQLPLDNNSQIIQHLGFLPHPAFCPKDAVCFLSLVWKRGCPELHRQGLDRPLRGKVFQKTPELEERVGLCPLSIFWELPL